MGGSTPACRFSRGAAHRVHASEAVLHVRSRNLSIDDQATALADEGLSDRDERAAAGVPICDGCSHSHYGDGHCQFEEVARVISLVSVIFS